MMRLGDTKNLRMDQVIYYVNKTDENVEENAQKLNNTDIFPPEGQKVPELTKYDEVDQDSFSSGSYDE